MSAESDLERLRRLNENLMARGSTPLCSLDAAQALAEDDLAQVVRATSYYLRRLASAEAEG